MTQLQPDPPGADDGGPPALRVATWNILNGTSLPDGRVDAARLREAAASLRVDALGLQEVDRGQPRSGGLDLVAEVAAGSGAAAARFVPALIGTPGRRWRAATDEDDVEVDVRAGSSRARGTPGTAGTASGGTASGGGGGAPGAPGARGAEPAYGVGLVSAFPVRSWSVLRLPAARVRSPLLVPGTRRVLWLADEPRVALAAVVDSPLGVLTVATTHLSFVPGWNAVQLRRLARWLRALPAPHLLLGDLNMPAGPARLLSGLQVLGRRPTYPAPEPRVQLDHVLGSADLPPVRTVDTPALPVSDHRPLVVELGGPDAVSDPSAGHQERGV